MFKIKHKIIRSALILTLANIITRLLGFFYRIFMSKTLGAEGMGLYQLISPIYMLVWAFTSAGLSTAVSKLTAEQRPEDKGSIRAITYTAVAFSLILSLLASAVVYIKAPFICGYFLKDERCVLSLRILSLCFPFMAAGSCLRGRFYGMQEAAVPAECQVLEQCARMGVVYLLFSCFSRNSLEAACAMAVAGMAAGEVISFIYTLIRSAERGTSSKGKPLITPKRAGAMLFALALPLTLNRVTGTLLTAGENLLIPLRLQLYGMSRSSAVALYGSLCGMAVPLVMFPSSLLTALSTALMPAVSRANAAGSAAALRSAVEKSLSFTLIVGIFTAGLFICLPEEIGYVVYGQRNIGYLLRLLGAVCPFIYLQVTLSGILNGLGKQLYIFAASLISSVFNIGFIWFFVPKYGIEAYIFGWFVSIAALSVISLNVAYGCVKMRLYLNNALLKPLAAIALSCLSLRFIAVNRGISLFSPLALIAAAAFVGGAYLALLGLSGALPKRG